MKRIYIMNSSFDSWDNLSRDARLPSGQFKTASAVGIAFKIRSWLRWKREITNENDEIHWRRLLS